MHGEKLSVTETIKQFTKNIVRKKPTKHALVKRKNWILFFFKMCDCCLSHRLSLPVGRSVLSLYRVFFKNSDTNIIYSFRRNLRTLFYLTQ